jgi:alkyl sulfatase BDS1-like metallo-beta-lactamase superfamily hydrolase
VRGAPDERIAQFMSTPARRLVLEGIFWQMPQHFDPKRAAGLDATVRWCVTGRADGGADTYELRIADGRCRVSHGSNGADPRLTITLDGAELVRLATGNSDPIQAYFSRRVNLAGDLMLAAKLSQLFRIPARRVDAEQRS